MAPRPTRICGPWFKLEIKESELIKHDKREFNENISFTPLFLFDSV